MDEQSSDFRADENAVNVKSEEQNEADHEVMEDKDGDVGLAMTVTGPEEFEAKEEVLRADEDQHNEDWQKYKSIVQSVVSSIMKGPELLTAPGTTADPMHFPETDDSDSYPPKVAHDGAVNAASSDQSTKKKKVYVCNEEKPYICSVCGDGFTQKGSMTIHMRSHSGEKPFACMFCDKAFSRRHILTEHLRTHSGETPYPCSVCGKSFSQERNLNRHMTIHSGEKPYTCTECGKGFNVQSNLTRHMTIHSGEKPYTCTECGKGFNVQSNLTTHMRIHSGERPYTCDVCGKGFSVAQHLQTHMRTHNGDRPYVCAYCGKGFAQHSNLATHLRIHSGEKPYMCELCGRSFREQGKLTRHMKVHDKAALQQPTPPEPLSTENSCDTMNSSEGMSTEQSSDVTRMRTSWNEEIATDKPLDFTIANTDSQERIPRIVSSDFLPAEPKPFLS